MKLIADSTMRLINKLRFIDEYSLCNGIDKAAKMIAENCF